MSEIIHVNTEWYGKIRSVMFSVQCGLTPKRWLSHDGCSTFVTMGVQHTYADTVISLAPPRPFFFSLSIKGSCIDESRSLSIRDQLHTKWSVQTGKKNVNGN